MCGNGERMLGRDCHLDEREKPFVQRFSALHGTFIKLLVCSFDEPYFPWLLLLASA
jgi:hypothetical protein